MSSHLIRDQNVARQLDLVGKVIIDKGSVPEWMEPAPDGLTGEAQYRFRGES